MTWEPPTLTTRLALLVRRRKLALPILLALPIGFICFMLVLPLGTIVQTSLHTRGVAGVIITDYTLNNFVEFFTTPVYVSILIDSMLIGLLVTVLSILLAYVPACVLGLNRSRRKYLLLLLTIVPFWTSFLIRTYSWIIVLGTEGVVNGTLAGVGAIEEPLSLLYARGAVIVGLIHALLPFAIVPIYVAVERIDDSFMEGALTLGATPRVVFFEIIVPLSMPGVYAASIVIFIEAMGAYITPQLLGGVDDMMIAMLIQERFLGSYDWPLGSAIAVIYLIFSTLLLYIFLRIRNSRRNI